MHATASHVSVAAQRTALSAASPGLEPGAATPPGMTFAEQLGRHEGASTAVLQLIDAALQTHADAAADAFRARGPASAADPGGTHAALLPSGAAPPRSHESDPAPRTACVGATATGTQTADPADASGVREFIARILPNSATPAPSDATEACETALDSADAQPHEAAIAPATELQTAVRVATRDAVLPAPVKGVGTPLGVRLDERIAGAQPTAPSEKVARAAAGAMRSSAQPARLRNREVDSGAEKITKSSPDPDAVTPEATAAANPVAAQPATDTRRDPPQNTDSAAVPIPAAGLALPPQPQPFDAPTTAGRSRFERLDGLPARYSAAFPTSRPSGTMGERDALPGLPAAPAPTPTPEVSAALRAPANPALDGATPNGAQSPVAAIPANLAPTSPAPPLHVEQAVPVASPQFRDAFALQVSVLARDGVQHAQVQLNPAELGPISVQIALDGQQAQIHFGCDSAQTRSLVEAGLPTLAAALRDAGLTLSGGGVSQHTPGQRHDVNPGREQARSAFESDDAKSAPVVRTLRVPTGRLDTYA